MYSINQIHNTILNHISDDYQKTEGFPTFDITRGISYGQYQLWKKAFEIEADQDIDNLTGDKLTKLVKQRIGLIRNSAVKAVATLKIVAGAGRIIAGDLFETATGVQFEATETKNVEVNSTVAVQALVAGSAGNVGANSINIIPITLNGIATVTNEAAASGGYDEETDAELITRYKEYWQIPKTCGNQYHYVAWAKSVDGVGNARCFPCWQGKNTVLVLIIGNDNLPAADSLVKSVQDYIDPDSTGKGLGAAPIGAVTTVQSAASLNIAISSNITISSSADSASVIANIKTALSNYIKSLAFTSQYVSYAHAGAAILSVTGVLDYDTLLLNGAQQNIEINDHNIAVLGEVTINVNT